MADERHEVFRTGRGFRYVHGWGLWYRHTQRNRAMPDDRGDLKQRGRPLQREYRHLRRESRGGERERLVPVEEGNQDTEHPEGLVLARALAIKVSSGSPLRVPHGACAHGVGAFAV